jgi:O-antigen/teichoic acid export membrane protein
MVWSSLLGLATIPIIVKGIGMDHFGLFGLFAVLLAPLSLANLGFGEATIKYVAEHAATGDYNQCACFVRTTLFFNLAVGVACGGLIVSIGPMLAHRFFNIPAQDLHLFNRCLVLVGATWAVNQAGSVFMGIPPAMQRFRVVATCQMVITTCTAVATVGAVLGGLGLLGYTAANLAGAALGLLVWYMAGKALLPMQDFSPRLDKAVWKRAFHFGIWQAAAQLGGMLANQAERFLLGAYLIPKSVGLYNVAWSLEQRAYAVVFKMSEVLFPIFSAAGADSLERKFLLLTRATWLLTSLSVCALVPMVGLARPLLAAWINPDTARQAGLTLQVLSIAGILGCATNATYFFLLGTGRTRLMAVLSFVTGVSTVLGALLIIPRFGLRGAAFGSLISMVIQQTLLIAYLLPRIFGPAFSLVKCSVAFHLPVVIGLALAFASTQLKCLNGCSLLTVLAGYALAGVLCACLILVCHWKIPYVSIHLSDAVRVLAFVRAKLGTGSG